MSESSKWKSKLLSSSVPLEYQVAKLLVADGFSIQADYSYSREDDGVRKDFSIDVLATAYTPFGDENTITSSLSLVIECKHRQRDNKWLFFPDPNDNAYSPFTLGHTIRAVDEFSRLFLPENATVRFDESATFCYKGVEVDLSTGAAHDAEIRKGLSQLQFALPRLVKESILFNVSNHEEDNVPFFYCPILVTTSEILVAKKEVSLEAVEAATSIYDIAERSPYVVVNQDIGPDFSRHQARECEVLGRYADSEAIHKISAARVRGGEYIHMLPSAICQDLASQDGPPLHWLFSQYVVCSLDSLPALIRSIKAVTSKASRAIRQKPRKVRVDA